MRRGHMKGQGSLSDLAGKWCFSSSSMVYYGATQGTQSYATLRSDIEETINRNLCFFRLSRLSLCRTKGRTRATGYARGVRGRDSLFFG